MDRGKARTAGGDFFFFTLGTGPRRPLRLKRSDTRVYEPRIRARLETTAHFCKVVVLKLRAVPLQNARMAKLEAWVGHPDGSPGGGWFLMSEVPL